MIYHTTNRTLEFLDSLFRQGYQAYAEMRGSMAHPLIRGQVLFYQTRGGVFVVANIFGLPYDRGECMDRVFGFHIHEGSSCQEVEGNDPFPGTLSHYNPAMCMHPGHAGDLPPLFGNQGHAFLAVLTNRFQVKNIIGRTVVIHDHPDDFKTQPAGDSGIKIACGVIRRA